MMTAAFSPFRRRWPLLGLATLCILLLAVLTLVWAGTTPAGAQDDYQPDQQLVANVWDYARETGNGFDHVLRWMRVLKTFGVVQDMTAAEAQENADQFWAERWDPVVAELTELEAQDDYQPDPQLVANVWDYARETGNGFDHVLRWMRVLKTLGVVQDMTAVEAQENADQYTAERWDPVVAELQKLEAATSDPEPTATPEPTPDPTPAAPAVTGVEVSSDAGSDNTYAQTEVIQVTVTFSEAVSVTLPPVSSVRPHGGPQLKIDMDPEDGGETWAKYQSGSGTASLTFAYTVQGRDNSAQGIAVLANTLTLNGGTVRSVASRMDAALSHEGLDHNPGHRVHWQWPPDSTVVPTVTAQMISSHPRRGDTYAPGETLWIRLKFNEWVRVSGKPRLKIDLDPADGGEVWAEYSSGDLSTRYFGYTVKEPVVSTDGIAVLADTLELNGGSIRSASSGTSATLSHGGLDHDANHKVNGIRETPEKVGESNNAPVCYGSAERLEVKHSPPLYLANMAGLYCADPEGDELTYTVTSDPPGVAKLMWYDRSASRVWFQALGHCDLEAITPKLPDAFTTTVTVTATDPHGASATGRAYFRTSYDTWLNNLPSGCPNLVSAEGSGKELTLTFDVELDRDSVPASDDFVVKVDGEAVALAVTGAVEVDYASVTLTLAEAVSGNPAVTVSYTPGDNPIQDRPLWDSVKAEAFEDYPVEFSFELQVSITASPAYPQPGEAAKLSAVIANPPAGSDPSYQWDLHLGGDNWLSFGQAATASYAHGGAGTITFRVTVSYDGGDAATSTLAVAWTDAPPNQAPVVNEPAEYYHGFEGTNNAPRGFLVWKIFTGIFTDPDGDELTYRASVAPEQSQLVESLGTHLGVTVSNGEELDFLFLEVDAAADWKAVSPALPDPLTIPVTLTATDPGGLSASVSGDFLTDWASHPALVSAVAGPKAVALTFDQEVGANPAPGPEQFTVNVVNGDGSEGTVEVNGVSVSGKVLTLELVLALAEGQQVTVDYAHDEATPLQRAAGGGDSAPDFTGPTVEVSLPEPPGQPENFALSAAPGGLDLTATWDALDGAASYKLRWRQGDGEFESANATTVANTSATITVSSHGQWEVRLQGCNDAGCGPEVEQAVTLIELPAEPRSANQGYKGQLGEVLVDLSRRRPPPPRREGSSAQSTHTHSIVYVIDDSGSMDGDFPEVRTALEAVRGDTTLTATKVALIAFGTTAETIFTPTDHPTDGTVGPWTDVRINAFGGKRGGTFYDVALASAKAVLDADTDSSVTTKKIIFLTDAQAPRPTTEVDAIIAAGIIVDTIGFGDHYSDNFDVIEGIATDTGGSHQVVAKPSTGTTNDPATAKTAMSDILTGAVADNTATLFLVDHSFSVYRANEPVLHPALTAAATKAGEDGATGRQVGLAIFLGGNTLYDETDPTTAEFQKYQVVNSMGSTSLSMDDGNFYPTGSTDIEHALSQAYSTVTASSVTATSKRVVLITDGISAADVPLATETGAALKSFTDDSATTLDVVAWGEHADRIKLKTWADSAGGTFSVAKAGPARPRGFEVMDGDNTAALSWTDPNDSAITKYQYNVWPWPTGPWSGWTDIPGSGASTTLHILTYSNLGYFIALRAMRDDVPGSSTRYVYTSPKSSGLDLTATAGDGEIALSWTDPSDTAITKYQYAQREGDGAWSSWTDIPSSGASTTSHTVTGLTNGTEYTIALRAVKGTGDEATYDLLSSVTATPSS